MENASSHFVYFGKIVNCTTVQLFELISIQYNFVLMLIKHI